jgi:phytoene synthase
VSPGASVDKALQTCEAITRRRARNFYHGLKLTPEPQRSALFAIYAWMRRADDLVDSASADAAGLRRRLDAFRAATDAALGDRETDDDYLWIALRATARRFDLRPGYFHAMLEGQIDDVAGRRYDTFDEVREYCYRVASTVGLICINVWGYRNPAAPELAVDRGIAFQLTNILRDYKQDYDTGRVYLPGEDFRRHGLDPEGLRYWRDPKRCQRMVMQQVARAAAYYRRSEPLDDMITPGCRPALWAMTRIYRGLLERIERSPHRIVGRRRLRLNGLHKGVIALRARWWASRNGAYA